MDDTRAILENAVNGLLMEEVTQKLLHESEEGAFAGALWAKLEAQGLIAIFDGLENPFLLAGAIIRACGRQALPLPLPETLVVHAVLPDELRNTLGTTPIALAETVAREGSSWVFGRAAFGRQSTNVLGLYDGTLIFARKAELAGKGEAIARDPRDTLRAAAVETATPKHDLTALAAMMRASQMAGAIERVLELTVRYATERVQFGKPIGNFQAIQQQLAILAGESAAATRAADAAWEEADRGGNVRIAAAIAKARAGEAAGKAASIAHQVHGAIGFTAEHVLHHFTRRLWTWRSEWGHESHWHGELGRHVLMLGAEGLWPDIATPA
ncbi:MAG TPA: acyl-CoA dehydrogenase family protein [Micropepsaceae bacterium]|nr:acyl-CoA dehydrogenase family protein [Micropepsaceae bacterium]